MNTHSTDETGPQQSNGQPATPLGILDLVVVAADIWPLLVLGPLLAGVIAYFVAAGQPSNYVAFSSFGTNAVVTEPVLRSMLNSDVGENRSRNVVIDGTSKMATITVTASTPDGARSSVSDALNALMLRPSLSPASAVTVSATLKRSQAQAEIFHALLDELQPEIAAAIGSEIGGQQNGRNDALTAFITLSDKLATLNNSNVQLQQSLDSKLIDSPDQAIYVSDVRSSKLAPSLLSALLVGLAIYLGALLRHLWRLAAADPRSAPKIARIRRSLQPFRSI